MKRVAVLVGCDTYDSHTLDNLRGAEIDARRMANALQGGVDEIRLVLSPTLQELQAAIAEISALEIADITIYFAGHGEVSQGHLFLCVRDTDTTRLAATSLAFTTLLILAQGCNPTHANIIIDACQSGGVAGDIRAALSSKSIGDHGSFGLSLLASCARDQPAMEDGEGGFCTTSIVKCISGSTFIQDDTEHLDLLEIARVVASSVYQQSGQAPVYWGVNLTGKARFCTNNNLATDSTIRRTLAIAPGHKTASKAVRARLLKLHQQVGDSLDSYEIRDVIHDSIAQLELTDVEAVQFTRQISTSISLASASETDQFRALEARISCIAPLLSRVSGSPDVARFLCNELEDVSREILKAIAEVGSELERQKYSLLGKTGTGELFYLPLRISKLLGWTGFALAVLELDPPDYVINLLDAVIDTYPLSCAAVCDAQAPFVACAVRGLSTGDARDRIETIVGLMFSDACEHRGIIASAGIPADQVIDYLLRKRSREFDGWHWLANPTSLIFTLMLCAEELDLSDEFDIGLSDLDYCTLNAFIPEAYSDFHLQKIEHGDNLTFRIGSEIWRVSDLVEKWNRVPLPLCSSRAERIAAAAASLVFPNRVAWCFLANKEHSAAPVG